MRIAFTGSAVGVVGGTGCRTGTVGGVVDVDLVAVEVEGVVGTLIGNVGATTATGPLLGSVAAAPSGAFEPQPPARTRPAASGN